MTKNNTEPEEKPKLNESWTSGSFNLKEKIEKLKVEMKKKGYSNRDIFYITLYITDMNKEFIKLLKEEKEKICLRLKKEKLLFRRRETGKALYKRNMIINILNEFEEKINKLSGGL